jgi:hypothetical protein
MNLGEQRERVLYEDDEASDKEVILCKRDEIFGDPDTHYFMNQLVMPDSVKCLLNVEKHHASAPLHVKVFRNAFCQTVSRCKVECLGRNQNCSRLMRNET